MAKIIDIKIKERVYRSIKWLKTVFMPNADADTINHIQICATDILLNKEFYQKLIKNYECKSK